MPSLAKQAIDAALTGNWESAIKFNEELIKENPQDVEALNRLSQASIETGNLQKAKKFCREVLKYDQYNPIALKKLEKIEMLKDCDSMISANLPTTTKVFVEEPGKTKIINLVNLATPQVLSQVQSGRCVKIATKKHGVIVTDLCDMYLGAFPDDIAHRLEAFLNGGCKYQALTKTVTKNSLSVFVIETEKPLIFRDQPSFLSAHNGNGKNGSSNTKQNTDEDSEDQGDDSPQTQTSENEENV